MPCSKWTEPSKLSSFSIPSRLHVHICVLSLYFVRKNWFPWFNEKINHFHFSSNKIQSKLIDNISLMKTIPQDFKDFPDKRFLSTMMFPNKINTSLQIWEIIILKNRSPSPFLSWNKTTDFPDRKLLLIQRKCWYDILCNRLMCSVYFFLKVQLISKGTIIIFQGDGNGFFFSR